MKKNYSLNPSTCICENNAYFKSIVDNSVIVCDEIINVTDSVSTNVMSTVSINADDKKVRYKMNGYVFHMFFLVDILLFMIAIIFYRYTKHRSKQKNNDTVAI